MHILIQIVFQWNGKECNHFEKLKADNLAKAIISEEKGGKGRLIKIEDGQRIPDAMMKVKSCPSIHKLCQNFKNIECSA